MSSEVADDLAAMRALSPKRGPQCNLCRLLPSMSEQHREAIRQALSDPSITDKAVGKWVGSHYGWTIDDPMSCVRHHRQSGHET